MKQKMRMAVSLGLVASLLSACGGGGSSSSGSGPDQGGGGLGLYTGKTTAAVIDQTSVRTALTGIKDVMPSCSATGVAKSIVNPQVSSVVSVIKIAQSMLLTNVPKKVGKSTALFSPTPPSASYGACGGSLTYPTYSHLNGTTTVSVKWDKYCTVDSITGNKTTYDGTLSSVDAGVSGASGPVTTKLTASIPGLTIKETDSTGNTVISNEAIALSNFSYVPKTGTTATLANLPGTTTFDSFESKDNKNNTSYKFTNISITSNTVSGGTQLSLGGTVCRSASGCSTLTTDTPLVMDSSSNLKSGAISFTGSGGHKATYTVSGTTGQQFTVAVDGTPVSGVHLNCSGL
jgi:hypothetical protein